MRRVAGALALLFLFPVLIRPDVPLRQEQLVYSILAFNGKDYSGTFSGEASDAIFVIADTDNFLTVRKTFGHL